MASDVTIDIGARNLASKVFDRVGKDVRGFTGMARRAASGFVGSIRSMATTTKKSTGQMASSFNMLKTAAVPLLALFAAIKAATAGFRVIGQAASAFDTQQEAVRGLTQALEMSGDTVGPTIEQHKAFASELQQVANVGDEVTLGLMKQASMLGVSNDQLQDVTKAAVGLSEATGQGLEASLRLVQRAIEGDTGALARYIPAIRNATTEEEKLAIITQTAEKGIAQKADRALTAAGSAERLSNSWGDFLEVVGEALAPVRAFISTGLAVLVETIQSAVIPALAAIMPSAETVAAAMEKMRVGIVKAVTFAEVVLTNFGSIWEIVKTGAALQITGLVEDFRHGFTVVVPAYAKWFSDNFVNMISDAFNASITVVKNATLNMGDILVRLWDFVRSGMAGGSEKLFVDIGTIASRSLLDGFEAQTQALPEVLGRSLTDSEQEMMRKIGGLATNLGDEYQQKLAERLGASGPDAARAGQISLDPFGLGDQAKNVIANNAGAKSASAGSGSAVVSRLLTRGQTESGPERMVKLLEKVDKKLGKLIDNTRPDESQSEDTFKVEMVG